MSTILVMTGSHRRGGNSDKLADAFIEGAESAGHTVHKFETAHKNIRGCIACDTCWSTGSACSQKDDFAELEPLLEQSDVLVLASPLYWFSLSSHLKCAIDKFHAYSSTDAKRQIAVENCYLLLCGADSDGDPYAGAVKTFEEITSYKKWNNKGALVVDEVSDVGDILSTDALEKARQMGANISAD